MKAAKNFTFGDGETQHVFQSGDEIPNKIADQLDDSFLLEKVAQSNPEALSREQLMALAGIGSADLDELAPVEYDEDELREALGVLRTKGEVIEWFEMVRPGNGMLDPDAQTRAEMEDTIVLELIGDEE